jgi:hypothetical protein
VSDNTITPAPTSPVGVLVAGIAFGAIGGALIGIGLAQESAVAAVLGYGLTAVSSLVALVGVVALGVSIGLRHDRALRK